MMTDSAIYFVFTVHVKQNCTRLISNFAVAFSGQYCFLNTRLVSILAIKLKMLKIKLISSFILFFFLSGNIAAQEIKLPEDKEIRRIVRWMTGSFDNFAQVDRDEENNTAYKHIRVVLHVQPAQIARLDNAAALYVENAAADTRQKPYRQRVYVVKRGADDKIIVETHRIKNQAELVNAYKNPALLKNLTLENLTHEIGCDLTFERVNSKLYKGAGGTNKTCKSTLQGATYTVSNTELTPNIWTNLDQGFDDAGAHKWGPPPGTIGYIFVKRNSDE
jgi:CpeT protein